MTSKPIVQLAELSAFSEVDTNNDEGNNEMAIAIKLLEDSHKADMDKLQLVITDLTRRLQNSYHTIDMHRRVARDASNNAELFRNQISEMSNILRLETAKNASFLKKKIKEEEANRYEQDKKKATKLHDDYRMALIDHDMTKRSTEPVKLSRMRSKLEKLEAQQESQKLLVQYFSTLEQMTEDLAHAAQFGDLEACSRLLKRGASVNELDSANFLPLHYACTNGNVDVTKLLLEFGADATSYLSGHAPCELAAKNGHGEVIKILVKFGANLEEKGYSGCTPIVSAAANNQLQCVLDLLQLGADINSTDLNGDSSLHMATKLQDPIQMIRLLLKHGADPKLVNRHGLTPLKMALRLSNGPSIEALGGRSGLINDDAYDAEYQANNYDDNNKDNISVASSVTYNSSM
jgi:ankyrin repeat protein